MGRIKSECDKIKNQLIVEYLLLYFCRLNTLKRTVKAPTVDLSRLNTLRRKLIGAQTNYSIVKSLWQYIGVFVHTQFPSL